MAPATDSGARKRQALKLRHFVYAGLAVFVGLPLLAAAGVALFVDADDIASRAAHAFTERTGQALTVRGASTLTYYPSPGAQVAQVEIANPEGFADIPFATARTMRASASWAGLLRGDVRIDSLEIDGLTANLERRQDGATNWAGLYRPASASADSTGGPPLSLARVQLSDARIAYADAVSGRHIALEDLNLTTGQILLGAPLEAEMTARVKTSWIANEPKVSARVRLVREKSTQATAIALAAIELSVDEPALRATAQYQPARTPAIEFDVQAGVLRLDPYVDTAPDAARTKKTPPDPAVLIQALRGVSIAGQLEAKSLNLRGWRLDDVAIGIGIANNEIRIAPISANLTDGRLEGALTVMAGRQPVQFQAHQELSGLRIDKAAERAGLALPVALGNGHSTLSLDIEGRVAPDVATVVFSQVLLEGAISMGRAAATMLPLKIHTKGAFATEIATLYLPAVSISAGAVTANGSAFSTSMNEGGARMEGLLATEPLDIRALAQAVGLDLPETADANALRAFSIDAGFAFQAGILTVDPATMTLDGSTGRGRLELELGETPAYDFNLDVDALDADRYRPPHASSTAKRPGSISIDALRALNANGTVTIGKLKFEGGTFDNVRLTVESDRDGQKAGYGPDAEAAKR